MGPQRRMRAEHGRIGDDDPQVGSCFADKKVLQARGEEFSEPVGCEPDRHDETNVDRGPCEVAVVEELRCGRKGGRSNVEKVGVMEDGHIGAEREEYSHAVNVQEGND